MEVFRQTMLCLPTEILLKNKIIRSLMEIQSELLDTIPKVSSSYQPLSQKIL